MTHRHKPKVAVIRAGEFDVIADQAVCAGCGEFRPVKITTRMIDRLAKRMAMGASPQDTHAGLARLAEEPHDA